MCGLLIYSISEPVSLQRLKNQEIDIKTTRNTAALKIIKFLAAQKKNLYSLTDRLILTATACNKRIKMQLHFVLAFLLNLAKRRT